MINESKRLNAKVNTANSPNPQKTLCELRHASLVIIFIGIVASHIVIGVPMIKRIGGIRIKEMMGMIFTIFNINDDFNFIKLI